jgi:cellulose biosynthesis protein BcsQ
MSSIVTFYSYKGGVGRSMALANIAYELSKRNKKVLMVDWDLEAPGLEKYFTNYRTNNSGKGLLPLLMEFQNGNNPDYKDYLWTIKVPTSIPLSLLHSGRNTDPIKYSADLEKFNWNVFFQQSNGGLQLEKIRQRWLDDFDFILIDSRTGLSDSSGICTIMMPDILIPMFSANYQSLFGIQDIVKYIQIARQKLAFERMALTILPIPSRFGTRVEFKESQEWLDRIADILKDCFSNWLPKWIEPRYILEQVKIPQIDYFSFGEKLAVIEQGTNDPEGMGYIYSRIAALLATEFADIQSFVGSEYYNSAKNEFEKNNLNNRDLYKSEFIYDLYISYPRIAYPWVRELLIPALTEYLNDELGYNPQIFFDFSELAIGDSYISYMESILYKSKLLLFVFSPSVLNSNYMSLELNYFLNRESASNTNLIFPIIYDKSENELEGLPEYLRLRQFIDFSSYKYEDTLKSTKLRAQFGQEIEKLANVIANSITQMQPSTKKNKKSEQSLKKIQDSKQLDGLLQLAKEYEDIRKNNAHGNFRTQLMENVVSRMKSISNNPEKYLPRFTQSESPGERLGAIATLQKFPNLNYIDWLSEHVGDCEKPFIGYHASIALYIAARAFRHKNKKEVFTAIEKAAQNLNKYPYIDPNQISVLQAAKTELELK